MNISGRKSRSQFDQVSLNTFLTCTGLKRCVLQQVFSRRWSAEEPSNVTHAAVMMLRPIIPGYVVDLPSLLRQQAMLQGALHVIALRAANEV
mmetsp:Transcript_16431/g.38758  ORF Transcript_16431/g.38758 Transcript_16431/m.38758 type:complete len:92 (-) Transcript_16431:163-438(-)